MSFPKLEIGDLLLTETYSGTVVEICQYRGLTGNLMYLAHHPDIILKSHLERFVKDDDKMTLDMRIVRKTDDEYQKVLLSIISKK